MPLRKNLAAFFGTFVGFLLVLAFFTPREAAGRFRADLSAAFFAPPLARAPVAGPAAARLVRARLTAFLRGGAALGLPAGRPAVCAARQMTSAISETFRALAMAPGFSVTPAALTAGSALISWTSAFQAAVLNPPRVLTSVSGVIGPEIRVANKRMSGGMKSFREDMFARINLWLSTAPSFTNSLRAAISPPDGGR
jgi:hypothetical protein